MESRNPVLGRRGAFSRGGHASFDVPSDQQLRDMYEAPAYTPPRRMTIDDVVVRTAITLGVLVAVAAASWWLGLGIGWAFGGLVVGLGLALFIIFKRSTNPALVLAYAAAEGVVLGVISHFFAAAYSGGTGIASSIVVQAVLGTVLAFAGMLAAYSTGVIKVTRKFVKAVVGAGVALLGLMVINLVAYLFVGGGIGIRTDSTLGILFSVAAIIVGCLFLALDFAAIEGGIKAGAPEKEAWLAAFGLTVTLVWLYIEILRLLSYLQSE